ncbi:MAG: Atxe2 family lasso peptide isopeptidase [Hyphomonadaceae bacterium]|nr:Atxe2 family lasso peptide isopeptidase [Hyphomonadaceae bacterium]
MRALLLAAALALAAAPPARAACETAAQELMNLTEIGGYREGLSIAPDGARAAFATRTVNWTRNDVDHTISVVALGPGRARALADAGGVILSESNGRTNGAALDRVPLWSPDSVWLAYLVKTGDRVELWRVRAAGGAPRLLYRGGADVETFAWLSNRALLLRLRTPRAERTRLLNEAVERGFRIDQRFDAAYALRPIIEAPGQSVVIELAHPGLARPATANEMQAVNTNTGADAIVRPLTPGDRAFLPAQGVFDGARRCNAKACSGEVRGGWRRDGRIYFLRGEGFNAILTALYQWDPGSDAVRRIRSAEDVLRGCGLAQIGLVCFQEASLQPRRLIAIDLDSGAERVLHDPNPTWRKHALTPVERLDVVDDAGNQSFAYLVYPADYIAGRAYPAVIVQYRARGFLNAGVGGEYPIHAFAACGYFVFAVERPEQTALQRSLPVGELMRRTELDHSEQTTKLWAIERLIDIAAARGLVDPARIAITGLSDGAETLYWGLTHSDRFAVAVAGSPPVDPFVWALAPEGFRHANRDAYGMTAYGPEAADEWRAWWEANAPSLRLERLHTPLLLQLGESEALHAMPLYARLRDRFYPVEAYLYPGAQHIKWRPRQILASRQRALAWIDFWLRNTLRADPADPDRAARWAQLRDHAR